MKLICSLSKDDVIVRNYAKKKNHICIQAWVFFHFWHYSSCGGKWSITHKPRYKIARDASRFYLVVIIHNMEQVALGSKIISDLVCLQMIIIIKCLLLLESNRSFSSVRATALNNLQFVSSDPPPSSFEASYSPRIISPPGVLRLLYHLLVYTVKKKGTKHCC